VAIGKIGRWRNAANAASPKLLCFAVTRSTVAAPLTLQSVTPYS